MPIHNTPVKLEATEPGKSVVAQTMNAIRKDASPAYVSAVPKVSESGDAVNEDIRTVGEVFKALPNLRNEFLDALVNRIGLVLVNSKLWRNPFAALKKGTLRYGEYIEEAFVEISKAREFSVDKAARREFARTIPDVRTALHSINLEIQYPVTIQSVDLERAFLDESGVSGMIEKIIGQLYTAANYDETLLFKYLIIKAVAHGKIKPIAVDMSDIKNMAIAARSTSNKMMFLGTAYNREGVHTATEREDQYIFLPADFEAAYDVNVLASAFNMDKATYTGHRMLIDDFDTFDNDRFSDIRACAPAMIEEVTPEELAVMKDVKAVLFDSEWFQVYDRLRVMDSVRVTSGLYMNYNYTVQMVWSSSPFSNAAVFIDSAQPIDPPGAITATITGISRTAADGEKVNYELTVNDGVSAAPSNYKFIQTPAATENGAVVHEDGRFDNVGATTFNLEVHLGDTVYRSSTGFDNKAVFGASFTLNKQ